MTVELGEGIICIPMIMLQSFGEPKPLDCGSDSASQFGWNWKARWSCSWLLLFPQEVEALINSQLWSNNFCGGRTLLRIEYSGIFQYSGIFSFSLLESQFINQNSLIFTLRTS